MIKGESYSIAINFNPEYSISRIEDIQITIGTTTVARLSDNTIWHVQDNAYRCELPGSLTDTFRTGNLPLSLYFDDSIRGIIKRPVDSILVEPALNVFTDGSINQTTNLIINIHVGEGDIVVDRVYLDIERGTSAYESYLFTTTDTPPLTEQEWSHLVFTISSSIPDLYAIKANISGGNTFVGSQIVDGNLTATGTIYGDGSGLINVPLSAIKDLTLSQIITGSYSASLSKNGGLYVNTFISASSFTGSGAGLTNIPASGIVGLNLSQISSGSYSASINPAGGLYVNTFITASNLTGSNTGDITISVDGNTLVPTGSNVNIDLSGKANQSDLEMISPDSGELVLADVQFSAFSDVSNFANKALTDNNGDAIDLTYERKDALGSAAYVNASTLATTGSNTFIGTEIVSGSLIVTQGISGSFSGSGANLHDIPAGAISGLNLSQISSGLYSASISQDGGLYINTFISASSFTGSLLGTASNATTASYSLNSTSASLSQNSISSSYASNTTSASYAATSSYASLSNIQYVSSSLLDLSQIEVADYSADVAVTFTNGKLKFIFGTPTVPSAPTLSFNGTFDTDRFNAESDNYDLTGSININGYTLVNASIKENGTVLSSVSSGTKVYYNTTTTGSHTLYSIAVTGSSPLDNSLNYQSVSLATGVLAKIAPGNPTITPTPTVQLGTTSSQIEQGATGSIAFTVATGSLNRWVFGTLTTNPISSPLTITGLLSGSNVYNISATATYTAPSPNTDTTPNKVATTSYSTIRSLRYGSSANTNLSIDDVQNIAAWDGTIEKGQTTAKGRTVTITWSGTKYLYIIFDYNAPVLTDIVAGLSAWANFDKTTIGTSYRVYKTSTLQVGGTSSTITYTLV